MSNDNKYIKLLLKDYCSDLFFTTKLYLLLFLPFLFIMNVYIYDSLTSSLILINGMSIPDYICFYIGSFFFHAILNFSDTPSFSDLNDTNS